ncbi:TPA: hypothetical protein P0E04_002800 [Vibrio campbellii]|nr:hypothetical protein [Vibrio campbellii]
MQIRRVEHRWPAVAAPHPAIAPSASWPKVSGQYPLQGAHTPALHPLGNTVSRRYAALVAVATRPTKAVSMSAANHHQEYVP